MPREDALVYWIGTSEERSTSSTRSSRPSMGSPAFAGVQARERRLRLQGVRHRGMEREFLDVMERLRGRADIRSVTKGEDDETPPRE